MKSLPKCQKLEIYRSREVLEHLPCPAQELKEFCEKHKWRLPSYEFSSAREGRGYVCRLTLPDANISGMQSGLQPNQKAAKAEVSVDGLKVAHMFAAQQELT